MTAEPAIHNFNVMLRVTDRENLGKVAELQGITMGQVARTALRAYISHVLHESPTCPNGNPCYVPHMHPRRVQPTG